MWDSEKQQHKHVIYGKGPDQVVHLRVAKPAATSCYDCAHSHLCNYAMHFRCSNFVSGGSVGRSGSCETCVNQYVKYDIKDPVPCFQCGDFLSRSLVQQLRTTGTEGP